MSKLLCIDDTKARPSFLVCLPYRGGGIGTVRTLEQHEVPGMARWLGLNGGRRLLDAFEVELINEGVINLFPVDDDGAPLHDECEALEIVRHDDGPRIWWVPRIKCDICCGEGHHNLHGEPVEEDDLCLNCCGNGYIDGHEFETDMDGKAVAAPKDAG